MTDSIYISSRRLLVMLGLLALALRVGFALTRPERLIFPDEHAYETVAANILRGAGPQLSPSEVAVRPPGYPYFLAAIRRLSASDARLPVRLVQALLGALAVWQVFVLAARAFGQGAGLLAAALVAVDPFEIFFCGLLLNEILFITLLLAWMYSIGRLRDRGIWLFSAGILAGLMALVKPSTWYLVLFLTPFVGFYRIHPGPQATDRLRNTTSGEGMEPGHPSGGGVGGWVWRWGRVMVLIALMFALQLLVVFPWMCRNHRRLGVYTLSSMPGLSLYEALGQGATGGPAMGIVKWPDTPPEWNEVQRGDFLKAAALRHAREHPGWTLRLSARKFARFWSPVLNYARYRTWAYDLLSAGWYLPVMALFLVGAWRQRRGWRSWLWLMAPAGYFALLHSVFVGSVRYRMPVMPLLCCVAGAAFVASRRRTPTLHYSNTPVRTLSVIVPFLNEAATLPKVVEQLGKLPMPTEIILVDDGSTDGGGEWADELVRQCAGVKVFHHGRNRGKGAAVRTGLAAVTGDVVVTQDADLEYDPQELARLWEVIERGESDVVYGSRTRGSRERSSWSFYAGGQLVGWVANLLYDARLTDEPTCYKMMRTGILRDADLQCAGFEFCPEITAKVLRRGIPIAEIPLRYYHPRSFAEGKKIRWTDGIVAIGTLLRYRFAD